MSPIPGKPPPFPQDSIETTSMRTALDWLFHCLTQAEQEEAEAIINGIYAAFDAMDA